MVWRAVMAWSAVVALMTVLCASGPPLSSFAATILAVVVAGVVACGARQSIVLAGLRSGAVTVSDDGPRSRSPFWVSVSSMAAVAVLVALVVPSAGVRPSVVVGLAGVLAIASAVAWPRGGVLRASSMSLGWFLVSGAALAAGMAAAMGAVVSVGRFGLEGLVAPGAFSRALAGTFLCDALVGVGGFVRAQASLERGVVRASSTHMPETPGPVLLAFLLAAPTLVIAPSVLPPLAATTAVGIKVVAGAVVGAALHLAGGVRGAGRVFLAHRGQGPPFEPARSTSTSTPG
jgi:hypothetical protein